MRGWTETELGNVCALIMGQAPPGEAYNDAGRGLPLIAGASDFDGNKPAPRKFTEIAPKQSRDGDIILGIRASIGETVWSDGVFCLGRGVAALRCGPKAHPNFLWHWLAHAQPELAHRGRGATFKQVTAEDISTLPISLPPLDEQRRIAAILDQADALRAKRLAALAQLDEMVRAIFVEMFGDLTANTHAWPSASVHEVCELIVDCVNRTAPIVDTPTEFKMIRTSNVRGGSIRLDEVRYVTEATFKLWNRRATPKKGDVILTREAPVGEAGILETDDKVFLGQRLMLYRSAAPRLTAEFLLFSFMDPFLAEQFATLGSGSTVKHLPLPACRSFRLRVPPIEMQEAFSRRVQHLRDLRARGSDSDARLGALFTSLQHRAFRGEL